MSATTTAHRPYGMYPAEWGPATHDPDNPFSHAAVEQALALRDAAGERPDDN